MNSFIKQLHRYFFNVQLKLARQDDQEVRMAIQPAGSDHGGRGDPPSRRPRLGGRSGGWGRRCRTGGFGGDPGSHFLNQDAIMDTKSPTEVRLAHRRPVTNALPHTRPFRRHCSTTLSR